MDQQPPNREHKRSIDQPTDEELIARGNAGDAAAFEALYLRYRDWVANLALRFTRGDRELALDVMQETFMHLLRRFPGFTLTAQLKTYLYPVVRHTALAMARKQRGRVMQQGASSDDDPSPLPGREGVRGWVKRSSSENAGARIGHMENLGALNKAIDALDPGQREALILRFADDLSLQEIAVAMEIPLGTVKSRLHNALARLREDARLRDFFSSP